MMMKNGFARSLKAGLAVVVLASMWVLFAPIEFGGSATYVIVAGASMEPELQQGDLVITRQAMSYNIGDVAAYVHPQVGPVIHRIIERDGPTYTFRGDNNAWVDSFEPTAAEILGRSWLHLPGGAKVLAWLRTPLGLSLLSLSVGSMFLMTMMSSDEHQKHPQKKGVNMFSRWYRQTQSLRLTEWVFPLSILLFAAVLLGLLAFTRPRFETVPDDLPYSHHGSFSYAGVGSPAVYDQGQIASGEAVFHALVDELDLNFTYNFESSYPADVGGTYAVYVRISEPNGWQRTLELQPEAAFQGDTFRIETTIDVDQITNIVEQLRERTAFSRQTFNVDVNVAMAVTGTLAGLPFGDAYTATLPFIMDEIEFYVDSSDIDGQNGDPLSFSSTSYLSHSNTIPNTLSLLGLVLEVRHARTMALVIGLISLALLVLAIAPAQIAWSRQPSERIKLNYSDRVIDVAKLPRKTSLAWIEVSSFDDLVKIGETSGGLILHQSKGGKHVYVVEHDGTGYRFTIQEEIVIPQSVDPQGGQEEER